MGASGFPQMLAAISHASPIEWGTGACAPAQEHGGDPSGAIHCITQQQPKV